VSRAPNEIRQLSKEPDNPIRLDQGEAATFAVFLTASIEFDKLTLRVCPQLRKPT
jgi:hypothetical protein